MRVESNARFCFFLCQNKLATQVELGERMALQVFAESRSSPRDVEDAQALVGSGEGGWARECVRVSRAEEELNRMAALARSRRERKHDTISQV